MKATTAPLARRALRRILGQALFLGLVLGPATAQAQAKIKLGFVVAVSGPHTVVAAEQKRGFDVAMDHLGGKLGGVPVEVVIGDSKATASGTVQELSKLIDKDKVDLLTGLTASNEIIAAIKPITDAKVFFVGMNGGPAQVAGAQCSPYYFNASFQNTQLTSGIGPFMFQKGVKKLYLLGMDFEAGHEHTNAARAGYTGEVVGHVLTPIAQVDFASDIAKVRASGADGVFAFYPGGAGIAFVRQWTQAGLAGKIPLFSNVGLSEPLVFQAQGKAALGIIISANYFADLDNAPNRKFVQEFRARYGRDPASFAGLAYDAMMLLDAAVREVKGDIRNQDAFRAALRRANYQSVRGPFKFNRNHQPIENTYVTEVSARPDGSLYLKQIGTIAENSADEFADKCPMK